MKAKALDRQSIFDIAIQHCGNVMAAYDIAHINGLSITEELTSGQELTLPAVIDKDVVIYFKSRGVVPATYHAPEIIFRPKLGALYNEWAVSDPRNISSVGWRVPTSDDYELLIQYLGDYGVAGKKLKENDENYWILNGNETNEVGFNLRGAGIRQVTGAFDYFRTYAKLRTQSQGFWNLRSYQADNWGDHFIHDFRQEIIALGCSVRLIKEFTTLSHGGKGIYVGNDGKRYLTICINNQEWLSGNLAETKFRNGEVIPEVADNGQWFNTTSAAWCAFNNDLNNI